MDAGLNGHRILHRHYLVVSSGMSMETGLKWHRTLSSIMLRYEYGGCPDMIMEAGLNWKRTFSSGMLRYEYGDWIELAQDIV